MATKEELAKEDYINYVQARKVLAEYGYACISMVEYNSLLVEQTKIKAEALTFLALLEKIMVRLEDNPHIDMVKFLNDFAELKEHLVAGYK